MNFIIDANQRKNWQRGQMVIIWQGKNKREPISCKEWINGNTCDYDNFIMSYQQFNHKPPGYSNPSTFIPWSQSVSGLFPPGTSFPFKLDPFSPYAPFLIHQQNNYYHSNFTLGPPSLGPNPNGQPAFSLQNYQRLKKIFQRKRTKDIIEISDDDEVKPAEAKPVVAVVRQRNEPIVAPVPQGQNRTVHHVKQQKQVIQAKRQSEITLERKEAKNNKKTSRTDVVKEEESISKKKKITKEKSGYKFTQQLRQRMEISRYRDYRPDLIMVGPQFQAKIDDADLYRDRQEWLHQIREGLQLRKQE